MRSADDAERRRRRDSASARDRADGVLQVARCEPLNALVNQYAQLVLDALRYAQSVEVGKERSDVVVALRANCQACGSVDDGLQSADGPGRSWAGRRERRCSSPVLT